MQSLSFRLELPRNASAPWLLRITTPEDTAFETIEKALAHGAQYFPPIGKLHPRGLSEPLELSGEQSGAFVGAVGHLQEAGASIELPAGLVDGLDRHVSASVRLGRASSGRRGRGGGGKGGTPARMRLDDLVTYDLEVALGGTQVDAEQLRKLARRAESLV
jgi:hypothetical protein